MEREERVDEAGEDLTPTRESRTQLRQMLAIGAIASVIGVALGLVIDWFPVQASTQAGPIDTLWDVLLIASVPIFVLVEVVVLYSVWKFRMRPGEELKDGPPIHGNTRLEIIWTAVPAILLVCLVSYAYVVMADIEEARADEMQVRVVGEQFTWTFHYRDGDRELVSNQLYVPEGQPVRFAVQSKDVIHDFWVPAFRMKIDAVPGITSDLRVTPNRRGEYDIVCAELCGLGHSVMRQTAHVVPRAEYDEWFANLREQGEGGAGEEAPDDGETAAVDGETLFNEVQPSCASCHTLAAAGATGSIGPNLDEVLQGQDVEAVRQSIVEPNAEITEGFQPNLMPTTYGQTMDPAEVDALAEWLVEVSR